MGEMSFGPGMTDGEPAARKTERPRHRLVVVVAHVAHLVHVDAADCVRILAPVNRIDVAIVQFGLAAEVERSRIARANVLEEEGVLGVVLDVAPVGAPFAVPVAVVEHAEIVLPLATFDVAVEVLVDRLFVERKGLRIAWGNAVEDLAVADPLRAARSAGAAPGTGGKSAPVSRRIRSRAAVRGSSQLPA